MEREKNQSKPVYAPTDCLYKDTDTDTQPSSESRDSEHGVLLVRTVLFTVYCFVFWSIVDSFWVSGKSCPSQTPSICLFFSECVLVLSSLNRICLSHSVSFMPHSAADSIHLSYIFIIVFVVVFDDGACSMLLFRCCSILMLSEKHATLLFSLFFCWFRSLSRYLLPIKYSKAIVRWPCIENRILKRVCVFVIGWHIETPTQIENKRQQRTTNECASASANEDAQSTTNC